MKPLKHQIERNSTSTNEIEIMNNNNQHLQKLVKVVEAINKTSVPTPTFLDKERKMAQIKRQSYFN